VEIHNKLCEVRLNYKSILSEKCFWDPVSSYDALPIALLCVCVMLWLLFTVSYCLIRITRASGPSFFAYHVALNNTSLLEWGTASVNLVTDYSWFIPVATQMSSHWIIDEYQHIHFFTFNTVLV